MPEPPNSGGPPPPEEPTRPANVRGYDPNGPPPDYAGTQSWMNDYNKAAQAHAQQQQPSPELTEKQQALQEMAQALAPKENSQGQQPQIQKGHER